MNIYVYSTQNLCQILRSQITGHNANNTLNLTRPELEANVRQRPGKHAQTFTKTRQQRQMNNQLCTRVDITLSREAQTSVDECFSPSLTRNIKTRFFTLLFVFARCVVHTLFVFVTWQRCCLLQTIQTIKNYRNSLNINKHTCSFAFWWLFSCPCFQLYFGYLSMLVWEMCPNINPSITRTTLHHHIDSITKENNCIYIL